MIQSHSVEQRDQASPVTSLADVTKVQSKSKPVNCSEANRKGEEMTQATLQVEVKNPFTTYRDPKTGRWVVVFPENEDPRQHQAEIYGNSRAD